MAQKYITHYFTSESVCAGHPDKICDLISDAILDNALSQDPNAKTAIETLVTKDRVIIAGEVSAHAIIDFEQIARRQITRLGYTEPQWGFSNQAEVEVYVHHQSPEIARGVNKQGAGDQGMMFGYACRETKQLMPLPIMLAHALSRQIDRARETGLLPYLRPDGKAQVTVAYQNGQPTQVTKVVVAVPHDEAVELETVKADLYEKLVTPALARFGFGIAVADLIVNGTGVWHLPGPASDTGVTGRKIIVDSYGGYGRVGGGCFSGKDPSKVDRSGAYAARYIAKNIVAAGLADRAEASLAYFIGAKKPIMQEIKTFGTARTSSQALKRYAHRLLDTSVAGIIESLNLSQPIYRRTAAYGHFGRPEFSWEKNKKA